VPLAAVAGKDVTTVEGLADGDGRHLLQQAFIDLQAGQCGYCLSGILMAAKALLDVEAHPSRGDVLAALDGNLCRCGAHDRIVRAVQLAGERMARG
jgi:nicotinate dehydrogenase subunit A